jgi:hypothetical protein
MFPNTIVDNNNYTSPIFYFYDQKTYQMNDGLMKRVFLKFLNNKYTTDVGWLYSQLVEFSYTKLLYDTIDSNLISSGVLKNHRLWVTFESPLLSHNTFRSYIKVQDFLANVGGLANILYVCIQIIADFHLRFIYLMFIRDCSIASNIYGKEGEKKWKIKDEVNNVIPNEDLSKSDQKLKISNLEIKSKAIPNGNKPIFNNFLMKIKEKSNENEGQGHEKGIIYKSQFSYFKSLVMLSIKTNKDVKDVSYFSYLKSRLFCESKGNIIKDQLKSVENILGIDSFCELLSILVNKSYKNEKVG